MSDNENLISLDGEFFIAKIVSGVAGPWFSMGEMDDATISISSEDRDRKTVLDGSRAIIASLSGEKEVNVSITTAEITPENREIIFGGLTTKTVAEAITDQPLGTVGAGHMLNLGKRKLSGVVFKSGNTTVDESTYLLDDIYGTVIFNTAPAEPVTWSGTAGVVERTPIASAKSAEYALLFKGVDKRIDTEKTKRMAVELWRVKFSQNTTAALLNEEWGSFPLEGKCYPEKLKKRDPLLGPYGIVDVFTDD